MNPKGEMKGSGITGPVAKEAADLLPVPSGKLSGHSVSEIGSLSDVLCLFKQSLGYG